MFSLIGAIKPISAYHADLTRIRRDLHANPELGFQELRTAGVIKAQLRAYGVDEIHEGVGQTGVVGVIHGKIHGSAVPAQQSVKTIGLRADMDALPMGEENSSDWISTKKGLMHGCGHDGHVTMLLGAARYLAATRNFSGTAYCIFQPGEEGYAGAKAMIQDGLFERFPAQEVYAMHNWPNLPVGKIGVAAGPMMAAADRIDIFIEGKGGHGAHAYQTIDPVVVAAHIITAVQSIVSRNVSPIESAVVSLCAVQAGDLGAMSVIPRTAKIAGTVRTFKPEVQDMVEIRLRQVCESVAQAFGAKATLTYERMYPATVNTVEQAQFAGRVADGLLGSANVIHDLPPSMGAEDFSFMLQAKPGAYLRIGQGDLGGTDANGVKMAGCFLHNTRYDFNDEILPLGAALFASLVEQRLTI
jgi:amidohydrolase